MCKGQNKDEKWLSNSVAFLSDAQLPELEVLQETEHFKTDSIVPAQPASSQVNISECYQALTDKS